MPLPACFPIRVAVTVSRRAFDPPAAALRGGAPGRRAGLTLLEVMVALVILGLVATGFLEAFAGALRASAQSRAWAQALVYAQEGQEAIKLEGAASAAALPVELGGGFERRIDSQPWRAGLERATVVVSLPGGARFEVVRLVRAR